MKSSLLALTFASLLQADLLRDTTVSGEEIVLDTNTGLIWQDDDSVISKSSSWADAIDHCENQIGTSGTFAGYSDWRLPNINELLTILDDTKSSSPLIKTPFVNCYSDNYWSSTSLASDSTYARVHNFSAVNSGFHPKSSNIHVRCVRGGE